MNEQLIKPPHDLTESQKAAAEEVESIFQNHQGKQVVLLEGLGGVGKTTLAEHIGATHPELGIVLASEDDIKRDLPKLIDTTDKLLITRMPPKSRSDFLDYQLNKVSENVAFSRKSIVVKGMTEKEMGAFVERRLVGHQDDKLPLETIVEYSLGIPKIADMLNKKFLTEEMAASILAGYLSFYLSYQLNLFDYISYSKIPDDLEERSAGLSIYSSTKKIYDVLGFALARQAEVMEKGTTHEDPVFIAPESEVLYDTMLSSLRSDKPGWNAIDILAPHLSDVDFESVVDSVGKKAIYGFSRGADRSEMFLSEWRKVSVWQRERDGRIDILENEYYYLETSVSNLLSAHKQGKLGGLTHSEGANSFFTHAHAHPREENPTIIGYMIETLLQQRGISYFARSGLLEVCYWYDAATERIVTLKDYPIASKF